MNVGNIQIRQAKISDAKEIALVHLKAWQESYHGIIDQSYLDSIDFEERLSLRKSILLNPDELSIHLVAIVDNKLVGFCSAGHCPDFSDEARGEIYAIYLLEAYKNLGIGGLFMQKVSDLLTQTGLIPYKAWVLKDNQKARHFYEKYGGQLTDEKSEKIGQHTYKEICYIFQMDTIDVSPQNDVSVCQLNILHEF